MASSPIPFAEGAPSDGLQVEVFGDDVLIGDPELDVEQAPESQFDENLAEELDSRVASSKADSLVSLYEYCCPPANRRSSNPVQCACRGRALSFRWSGQNDNRRRPRRRD